MQKLHFIVQKLKWYLKMNAGKVKCVKEYMLLLWIILSYPSANKNLNVQNKIWISSK